MKLKWHFKGEDQSSRKAAASVPGILMIWIEKIGLSPLVLKEHQVAARLIFGVR